MKHADYHLALEPGGIYHIYNRGNNHQQTFFQPDDYQSFLNKWRAYIHPIAKTLAYALLGNHFHAAVQIRQDAEHKTIQRAFTNFFISYSRTIQNRYEFHGSVFHKPFKRKLVKDDFQLDYLIAYIHYNAVKHGIWRAHFSEYPHTSYQALIRTGNTLLERDWVMDYFGGLEKFVAYHASMEPLFTLRDDLEL